MQSLNSTTSLTISLLAPVATVEPSFFGSYVDSVDGSVEVDAPILPTVLNGATPVTLLAAPAVGTVRHLVAFAMTNTDTAAATAKVTLVGPSGSASILFELQAGDVLQFGKNSDAWTVTAANGGAKQFTAPNWGQLGGTLAAQTDLQSALDAKVPTSRTVGGHALTADVTLAKGDVGLGNVDNTSDANKPVSTAQATALGLKVNTADVQQVGVTSTATAGATTTLTSASAQTQAFTGTLAQTLVLPAANTLAFVGWSYCVVNNSTGSITVQANGGGAVAVVSPGWSARIKCTSIATSAGTWLVETVPLATANAPGAMSAAQSIAVDSLLSLTPSVPLLILETDWGQDADDVGLLAVAHRLADLGEARIIAVINTFSEVAGVAGVSAINTFYGRPDIPIGLGGIVPSADNYLSATATFPNRINADVTPPTGVSVTRQALASAPDASVTWYVSGPMTNLSAVWHSPADSISPLAGPQLMARKLAKLVVLGGSYPGGASEYDFYIDPTGSHVINLMGSFPIVFQGFECGSGVLTRSNQPRWSPVRAGYESFFSYYGGVTSRDSWGALGVLYCVRGLGSVFTQSAAGTNTVATDGNSNTWTAGSGGLHHYLILSASTSDAAAILQPLQDAMPKETGPATALRTNDFFKTYSLTTWPTNAGMRNNFTGAIGYTFTLTAGKRAFALGRFFIAGNTHDHIAKLWDNSATPIQLASVTIKAASVSDANGYKWGLIGPIDLPAGKYYVGLDETTGQDQFKDDWAPTFPTDVTNVTGTYVLTPGACPTGLGIATGHIWDTPVVAFGIP